MRRYRDFTGEVNEIRNLRTGANPDRELHTDQTVTTLALADGQQTGIGSEAK